MDTADRHLEDTDLECQPSDALACPADYQTYENEGTARNPFVGLEWQIENVGMALHV